MAAVDARLTARRVWFESGRPDVLFRRFDERSPLIAKHPGKGIGCERVPRRARVSRLSLAQRPEGRAVRRTIESAECIREVSGLGVDLLLAPCDLEPCLHIPGSQRLYLLAQPGQRSLLFLGEAGEVLEPFQVRRGPERLDLWQ